MPGRPCANCARVPYDNCMQCNGTGWIEPKPAVDANALINSIGNASVEKVAKQIDYVAQETDMMLTRLQEFADWGQLNDWEQDFVDSCTNQFRPDKALSEKQMTVLKRIFNKHR